MHICISSPLAITDKTHWGGIHTHTKMLLNLLVKGGHKITLIATSYQNKPHEELIDGIRIVFISGIPKRMVEKNWFTNIYKSFSKIHKEDPIDCIISEGYSAGYSTNSLKKALAFENVPILTFVHIFHLIRFYNTWKEIEGIRSLGSYVLRTVPKVLFRMFRYEIPFSRSCCRVISVSELNVKYLRRFYRISEHKIKVIHNWVDTDKFVPNDSFRRDYRQRLNIPDNSLVFLLVGAVWKPKGVRIAIEAFNKFVTYYPDALLMIAGEGRDEEYLHKFIAKNESIKNKVQLLGHCNHSELPHIYNSADIFLMPTLRCEGHAYTLIEAMACGLPSIATRLGGNIETIGEAGILVPAGNVNTLTKAMIELAQNPEKKKGLSYKARERVIHYFSEEVAAQKISLLLSEVSPDKLH